MLDYYMLTTVRYDRLKNRGRGVVQYTSANILCKLHTKSSGLNR